MTQKNFSTPPIAPFIFSFKEVELAKTKTGNNARWVNAFNDEYLGSATKNFYPTETLYGEWNGEILILAQDALPASALNELISSHLKNGEPKEYAWRHANQETHGDKKGWRTNNSLKKLVEKYANGCSVLYGSAAAHMLYDDGCKKYRQSLRGFMNPQLQSHLIEVLNWVVKNMPNLRYIMCLGEKAWQIANASSNSQVVMDFKSTRQANQYIRTLIAKKPIIIIPAYHPMAVVTNEALERNWQVLAELLGMGSIQKSETLDSV